MFATNTLKYVTKMYLCNLLCHVVLLLLLLLLAPTTFAHAQQTNLRINTDLTLANGEKPLTNANNNNNNKNNNLNQYVPHNAATKNATAIMSATTTTTTGNSAAASNICTREETYVERIEVPTMEPVRIRTSSWCLEFPPRCTSYKTTMRERVDIQNVTKTRTIRFCCDGYEGNISNNDTVCKPVCRGGCGRGHCQKPDVCSCEPGYTGKHCTQRCDHDRWGLACQNICQCKNDAVCDNKSGICHCIAGWTGQLCELPCPLGTHGVMCRKQCKCGGVQNHCHPQTGACAGISSLPPNVTHVMIETLNSTIVNITHNLDRIAKNIGHITSTSEQPTYDLTPKPMPEVILIKQEETQHTPKIIVHQPGTDLLENLHTATASKTPDVIHLITSWPTNATPMHENKLNLAGFGGVPSNGYELTARPNVEHSEHATTGAEHETNLLTTLLVILLIIMIGIAVSFLYVYRRYHWHKARVEAALAVRSNGSIGSILNSTNGLPINVLSPNGEVVLNESRLGKSFLKPLPDLPAFTQAICNKIDGPELYDSPSNNSSIKTPPYTYARKESLYSVVAPKSRKGSLDSHLYDEIRYPGQHHHHHQHQHQQQHQQHHHHHHQHHQNQQHQQHGVVVGGHQQQHQQHQHQTSQPRYQHATTAAAYLPPATHTQPSSLQSPPIPVHHVSHFIIPPQNTKFLQVPTLTTTHKVATKVAHL